MIVILLLSLIGTTHGIECPWNFSQNILTSDLQLTSLEQLNGEQKELSLYEIKQDLACLKIVFEKQYIAEHYFKLESRSSM